jgi:hypothetical protein
LGGAGIHQKNNRPFIKTGQRVGAGSVVILHFLRLSEKENFGVPL